MRTTYAAALFALALGATPAAAAAAASADAAPSGYLVVLEDNANASSVARQHANAHGFSAGHVYAHALRGYSTRMSAAAAARIARDDRVQFVQPDGVVRTAAQSLPTGVDRVDAEQSVTAKIDGVDERVDVDVAVIDTGVDFDHPDLNVHTAGAMNCSTGRNADDGNGHGSHVAGTIGATDDGAGVVGVAPGARVWPVRVLNNAGSGTWSDVVCGIDYVTAHADQIEVANMSLGGGGSDDGDCGNSDGDAMHKAICASVAAGVTYAVAAGNSAIDSKDFVPAAYDEVITVSALADFDGRTGGSGSATCRADVDDTLADFSNYGADVDLIAPGVCISSTWKDGGYNTISGTSMASPHVAGGAALYAASHAGASPSSVKAALQSAGGVDWDNSDDGDSAKERLLNVAAF